MIRIQSYCLWLALIGLFCVQNLYGCTEVIPSLRKKFNRAESVFTASVLKISDYSPTDGERRTLPKIWRDHENFLRVTLSVNRSWKSARKGELSFISIPYFPCFCVSDNIDEIKEGEEYLVFANKSNFLSPCEAANVKKQRISGDIRKLDGFWFRSWATVYPF